MRIIIYIYACLSLSCDIFCADILIELKAFDIYQAYENNNLKEFMSAVEIYQLDLNQINKNGFSLAHLAAREGKNDWLAALNMLEADLDKPDQGLRGWPPIAWAISTGKINTVKLLLGYGVPLVIPSGRSTRCRRVALNDS
jgi:ankyrin repeat protein